MVVGKGAAYARADGALRGLVDAAGLPFLATAMGRGVVPDSHPGSVQAARSAALRGADVVLVVGARWEPQRGQRVPCEYETMVSLRTSCAGPLMVFTVAG